MNSTDELAALPIRILVAEDDREMRDLLARVLRDEGYELDSVKDGKEAMVALEEGRFDVVLTDLKMPGASGMEVMRKARAKYLHQPVILMTAFGTIESAVLAMKEGAYSYIAKPFDIDELTSMLKELALQIRLRKRAESCATTSGEMAFPIVFRSREMQRIMRLVHEVAVSNASVLITGESGTGKELIAREVHRQSARRKKTFMAVDANAIPENLIESELFGHVRGSFTGATADKRGILEQTDGGTLFLDEIGNLDLSVQSKFLRFLQERTFRRVGEARERTVDVRVITATNKDILQMMKEQTFREDLYYRVAVFQIHVPSLRDRRDDIAPLAYHFLRKYNQDYHVEGFRPDVIDLMMDFPWPGNVRQLENAVEHAVILRKAGLIQRKDLPMWISDTGNDEGAGERSLDAVEMEHILKVLKECDGNKSRAAKILGINRRTLSRKLIGYGLSDGNDADGD